MPRLELTILGCGSATSSMRHQQSSQVLNVRDNLLMIDCGEGTQLQMRRMKVKFSRLRHIFISHLHGDHCLGLPGLISTLALQDRTASLTVHMMQDGIDIFKPQLDYLCRERPFEMRFNAITPHKAVIYEDDAITVSTFPLRHRVPAIGFIFREKPKRRHINSEMTKFYDVPVFKMNDLRDGADFVTADGKVIPNAVLTTEAEPAISYAYCSDTMPSKRVINAVQGVDWLYHEATYDDNFAVKAHKRAHSTASDAATAAREAGVKHLIIGHFSKRYTSEDLLLQQAQAIFHATHLAYEGLVFDLNKL